MFQYDAEMLSLISEADAKDEVLRYVGVVDVQNQRCEVGLKRYSSTMSGSGGV